MAYIEQRMSPPTSISGLATYRRPRTKSGLNLNQFIKTFTIGNVCFISNPVPSMIDRAEFLAIILLGRVDASPKTYFFYGFVMHLKVK